MYSTTSTSTMTSVSWPVYLHRMTDFQANEVVTLLQLARKALATESTAFLVCILRIATTVRTSLTLKRRTPGTTTTLSSSVRTTYLIKMEQRISTTWIALSAQAMPTPVVLPGVSRAHSTTLESTSTSKSYRLIQSQYGLEFIQKRDTSVSLFLCVSFWR